MQVETLEFYVLDYVEFDNSIEAIYGRNPKFVVSMESSNDTVHEFYVLPSEMDDWNRGEYEDWLRGYQPTINPNILLDDMCLRGVIPSGRYLVRVSW